MLKTYLISALVGLGIAGAIFAFQVGGIAKTTNSTPENTLGVNASSNKPRVEALALKNAINSNEPSENLTELITKEIGKNILRSNPNGPININGEKGLAAPDPETIAEQAIEEAAKRFDFHKYIPQINEGGLKIFDTNNREDFIAYGEKFDSIMNSARNKNPESFDEINFSKLDEIIINYEVAIKNFYGLSTPRHMLGIHKTQIQYLSAELSLLKEIRAYQKDPLTAILAVENFFKLDEEFNLKLNEEFQKFLQRKDN